MNGHPLTTNTNNDVIRVMLVDDSAVIRGLLKQILSAEKNIEIVAAVMNGELGVEAAAKHKPHVVILDVEMPVMDGLTALPKILEASPASKVVMFSSLTAKGADTTLKAMSLGAVECLVKPSSTSIPDKETNFNEQLIATITGLVPSYKRASITKAVPTQSAPAEQKVTLRKNPLDYTGKPNLIAIGSSTGGPQALFNVTKHLKDFDVPIVITQHMPATFTKILAEHINQQTGIPAHEGENGMKLENGHIYVAPGGFHMFFERQETDVVIRLNDGPPENFCKPAVDAMYRSALEIYGNKMLGVILTGMGNDGQKGGEMLTAKNGRLIAQDEETSVVWGMPGAVAMAGVCSEILPIDDIGPWIRRATMK